MAGGRTRSEFVTVIAWLSIVFTGLSTLFLLLENVMFRSIFSGPMAEALSQARDAGSIPPLARLMMGHLDTLLLGLLLFSLSLLITSVALLKRKNWARLLFIVFMTIGVLWNAGGLALQSVFTPDLSRLHNAGAPEQFVSMMIAIRWGMYVICAAFVVLFLWIIAKLSSKAVREEFRAHEQAPDSAP
ncbi:MAG: hypothetical protein WB783_02890 [Arenicellales bacterium]|jgi:hypothetical protein